MEGWRVLTPAVTHFQVSFILEAVFFFPQGNEYPTTIPGHFSFFQLECLQIISYKYKV